jgi:hypothetical protein
MKRKVWVWTLQNFDSAIDRTTSGMANSKPPLYPRRFLEEVQRGLRASI